MERLGGFRDPCTDCNALCCNSYKITGQGRFHGIIIKEIGMRCAHLAGTHCNIHTDRKKHGFHICEEYTCYGTGPLVSGWKCGEIDNLTVTLALNKARLYMQELLDFDSRQAFDHSSEEDYMEGLKHIEYILTTSPKDYFGVKEHWDSYLYPKRWFTKKEQEEKERRLRDFLKKFLGESL